RFKILDCQGSPFQILDYINISNQDGDKFASNLIKEHSVVLVPISSLFETPQDGLLILCFAKKYHDIIKGSKILANI
ncbi:aminotransferase, partial [Francisella tularensis subsp. holarctica]|nr:aminotransferase [Francisella tularensis subsp. holarctica]